MAPTTSGMHRTAFGSSTVDAFSVFELTSVSKEHPKDIICNGSSRLDHSLIGFDPLLEISESRDDQGPWNYDASAGDMDRPERSSPSPKTIKDSERDVERSATTDLRELAAELAKAMPRALTKEEEVGITLGSSAKESSAKREKKMKQKADKQAVPVAPSTPKPRETMSSRVVTPSPKEKGKALRRAFSSKLSPRPKNKKSPPSTRSSSPTNNESTPSSSPIKTPKLKKMKNVSMIRRKSSVSSISDLDIPTLAKPKPTSFLKDGTTMALKTSEQDPSDHQVEIPSSSELSMHSRLCAILDSYDKLQKDFNFNDFKGVNLHLLQRAAFDETQDTFGMTPVHKALLQQLLNCADDIRLEGFFTHGSDKEMSKVAIFSLQSSSRFIVVYRGPYDQQFRPARISNKSMVVSLDSTENAGSVYVPFRDTYFSLETEVYRLLDKLMEQNPFSHIIFVGHSFGGALATIGAVRFASARPMQCFSCHVFGSPKVGIHDFRTNANSLSNLKVMRVEYGSDPNACIPADVGSLKWEHVGHTISIPFHGVIGTTVKPHPAVMAYRFDNKKPPASLLHIRLHQNSIHDYVGAIEPFAKKELAWVSSFVGEDGKGVVGKDNEKRFMV